MVENIFGTTNWRIEDSDCESEQVLKYPRLGDNLLYEIFHYPQLALKSDQVKSH